MARVKHGLRAVRVDSLEGGDALSLTTSDAGEIASSAARDSLLNGIIFGGLGGLLIGWWAHGRAKKGGSK